MSVKFIDNHCFYGYRVRRTAANKMYQEYFSLTDVKAAGKDGRVSETKKKLVLARATRRDNELIAIQKQYKKDTLIIRSFRDDGSVKGISVLYKKEKSGNISPVFQVGCGSLKTKKIVCSSFSINAHGERGAWAKAVDCFCHHKEIKSSSELYRKLLTTRPKLDQAKLQPAL